MLISVAPLMASSRRETQLSRSADKDDFPSSCFQQRFVMIDNMTSGEFLFELWRDCHRLVSYPFIKSDVLGSKLMCFTDKLKDLNQCLLG